MRAETPTNASRGSRTVPRHRRAARMLGLCVAGCLLFALAGDRGRAQSYAIQGIDPLEVLDLKVKPNVVVVLDSSTSMAETLTVSPIQVQTQPGGPVVTTLEPTKYLSGDHPESKMGKAKEALRNIFQRNETRVSFAFATYAQAKTFSDATISFPKPPPLFADEGPTEPRRQGTMLTTPVPIVPWRELISGIPVTVNRAVDESPHTRSFRFLYYTSDRLTPAMADELQVAKGQGDPVLKNRGFQAWQDFTTTLTGPADRRYLYFQEGVAACDTTGGGCAREIQTPVNCVATVPTTFQASGLARAAELEAAMNAATCSGSRANTYSVGYDGSKGTFVFKGSARDFRIWRDRGPWDASTSHLSVGPAIGAARDRASFSGFWGAGVDGVHDTADDVFVATGMVETVGAYSLAYRTSADSTYAEGGVTYFNLYTSRFFNGETLTVDDDGVVCTVSAADAENPSRSAPDQPVLWVKQVDDCAFPSASVRRTIPFTFAGAATNATDRIDNVSIWSEVPDGLIDPKMQPNKPKETDAFDNDQSCSGISYRADLRPCDSACLQFESQIAPWLEPELILTDGNDIVLAENAGGGAQLYSENPTTGLYESDALVTSSDTVLGGIRAAGNTPIATTLRDIKETFTAWWNDEGPVDCPAPDGTGQTTLPFRDHDEPAAPTIVVFVSDGNDTCTPTFGRDESGLNVNALEAALAAEALFSPVEPSADPGTPSSVTTYMIAFGEGVDPTRLNWIAWGGSGLGQGRPELGMPDVDWTGGGTSTQGIEDFLRPLRGQCATCSDAFVARDGAELETIIQALIDQGVTSGTFSAARQSITDSVYEYVSLAGPTFSPDDPDTRYKALAPTRFISTFSLPGFRGELTAWQADQNGDPDPAWPEGAGSALLKRVHYGVDGIQDRSGGTDGCAVADRCTFAELTTAIDRRIYTSQGNGVFYDPTNPVSLADFSEGTAPQVTRKLLWPPASLNENWLIDALGLPTDPIELQEDYGACVGVPMSSSCDPGTEARQMVLAFMAGAEPLGPRGAPERDASGNILYRNRSWVLAESIEATPAVLGPPLSAVPEVFTSEYKLFRSGRNAAGDPLSTGMVARGCGLRDPADDTTIQPVMTVVFLPANDMLHAFRAGPCVGCPNNDLGGEELWGFVPFDLLPALRERYVREPQGREDHVYMLARGIRYADVFFPATTTDSAWCGAGDGTSIAGLWRRVVFFGRGAGGKFLTALDVTSPGSLRTGADQASGPVLLWSRGNPDKVDATRERPGTTDNHNFTDTLAYAGMGETWSLPVVALVDSQNPFYAASPRDSQRAVSHALFVGSGYGDASGCGGSGPCEGATFYTLDALTGDVIASADVGQRAALLPTGPGSGWYNALVANPAGFNPRAYSIFQTVHPSASKVTRVYIGDLHGRLWKFLTAQPDTPIQLADLSITVDPSTAQPVGTAAGLIGLPPYQGNVNLVEPFVYVTSGNDRRASASGGPFRIFGFRDTGGDLDTQLGSPLDNPDDPETCPTPCNVRTYEGSAGSELLFAQAFPEGQPDAGCAAPLPGNVFRGTVQPATSFEVCSPASPSCTLAVGRVFFGGTRLNLPGTLFAPPTPIACGTGEYPCRSSFDSIVFALGAETGLAAYDLNATGDDAYRIYRDQRISAISMAADPSQSGGSQLLIDEGQLTGEPPSAPPPAGVPPTAVQSGSASVVLSRDPNFPPAAVRMGSTVCQ